MHFLESNTQAAINLIPYQGLKRATFDQVERKYESRYNQKN
ncbi:hypothetical protein E5S67_03111 [Microcoleus sp. IPMA8]|uniref:Uncharacterized protein n=1 Tax=Microcoleus asticus IPMA8 TaxID=2563858 RepID=A0ABX2CYC2_9CYAN|nr:hypothetical protein [Microcoleus asticus IPMA8]